MHVDPTYIDKPREGNVYAGTVLDVAQSPRTEEMDQGL